MLFCMAGADLPAHKDTITAAAAGLHLRLLLELRISPGNTQYRTHIKQEILSVEYRGIRLKRCFAVCLLLC